MQWTLDRVAWAHCIAFFSKTLGCINKYQEIKDQGVGGGANPVVE